MQKDYKSQTGGQMIMKYKQEITMAVFITAFSIAFYHLYQLLLPFILGLILAFSVNELITRIQKIVRNRNLATTVFLTLTSVIVALLFVFLTQYINRDFKRLNHSFTVLVTNNKDSFDKAGLMARKYLGELYHFDGIEHDMKLQYDSLKSGLQNTDASTIDTEAIKASFDSMVSFFESDNTNVTSNKSGFSTLFILSSTILYFILILYQFEYFANLRRKYFGQKMKDGMNVIIDDFNQSFVKYFKLRTRIVLILSLVYLTAFIIMDMPGVILFTALILLLSYIPYFQYFALIPLSLGCLVLSIENNQSFLLYFGIVASVFLVASLIEELVLNPWIMEKNIGMNPVIMILAISVWGYLLGMQGLLLGIPITSLMIIYFKRYFLNSFQNVFDDKT